MFTRCLVTCETLKPLVFFSDTMQRHPSLFSCQECVLLRGITAISHVQPVFQALSPVLSVRSSWSFPNLRSVLGKVFLSCEEIAARGQMSQMSQMSQMMSNDKLTHNMQNDLDRSPCRYKHRSTCGFLLRAGHTPPVPCLLPLTRCHHVPSLAASSTDPSSKTLVLPFRWHPLWRPTTHQPAWTSFPNYNDFNS